MFERVELCRSRLKAAQMKMENNPYDDKIKFEEAECLASYLEVIDYEETPLFLEAKIEGISNEDKNSRYFHKVIQSNGDINSF